MIGEKIRSIRKSKNLTIVQLSEKIDVTSGYISQIERDLISPSLGVLKKLSEALEVPLSVLFQEDNEQDVVAIHQKERTKVKYGDTNVEFEYITPIFTNGEKNNGVEAFLFKLAPKSWASEKAMFREKRECIFLLSGELQCHIGKNVYTLHAGDSISVPENNSHLIYNSYDGESEALCIISPPKIS